MFADYRKETTLRHCYSFLAALALLAGTAAVEAADLKIGFIDAERVNRESAPAERASKQLEKEFAPRAL
jgi:outer membrane protein